MIAGVRRALALSLALGALGCGPRTPSPESRGANVVLISIDTLRADHLPSYGYAGVETPSIDALRRDAILFLNAYSHCPLTLPSHVSILTGLAPPDHGVRDNLGYVYDGTAHPGLPAWFKAAGYRTGAAVSAFVLRGETGLSASFDSYDGEIPVPEGSESAALAQRPGQETEARAEAFLASPSDRPFFLFFHVYEPHLPYEPPEPFKSRYAAAPYDGEIATADAVVGRLLAFLKARGLYDRSLVVLLSDHGEGLSEHGEADHGILLYREVLHVPLIVKLPGGARAGTSVDRAVALIDVAPTFASLVGLQAPPLPGMSLLGSRSDAGIYSETYYPRIHLGWSALQSLTDGRYHLIDGPSPELYDLSRDPGERSSVLGERRDLAGTMQKELRRLDGAFVEPKADPASLERLRSLGYLGGGAEAPSRGPLPNPRDHLAELEDIKRAYTLASQGANEAALALLERILARNPRVFDVALKEGEVLLALGRPEDAIRSLTTAADISPALGPGVAAPLARAHMELGRLKDARGWASRLLEVDPPEAHSLLAEVALKGNDLVAAESESQWLSSHPGTGLKGALVEAEVRIREGRYPEALEILPQGPHPPRNAAFLRGDALARLQRLPEAAEAFRGEIQAYPTNSEAYARLAIVSALEQHTRQEVFGILDQMVAARPGRESALLAAKTLESLGAHEAAEAWRKRAGPAPSGS
jgi:arylsulfatase A-like enzyme/predicted negative regulator of RcsB-dependent stress response